LAFIDKILNLRKLRYSSTNTNPSWDQIFCSEEEDVQRRQVNFLKVFKGTAGFLPYQNAELDFMLYIHLN
jgi:hypothetical protein